MSALDEIAAGELVTPGVRVRLLTTDEILTRSGGHVVRPETVNYSTYLPEKGGLFCQEIFGALRGCACGHEPKIDARKRDMGAKRVCGACGKKAPLAASRRRRFGHIALAAPVVHPWFAPALVRRSGLAPEAFDLVRGLERHLVVADGVEGFAKGTIIDEDALIALVEHGVAADAVANGAGALERLTGPHPAYLRALPVLPPHLRPIVPLGGGRYAYSDVNDLYRRVINRNNRLARLVELRAPEIIVRNEKRMLQEAVDALLDNERRPKTAVLGPNRRYLESLAHGLGDPERLDQVFDAIGAEIAAGRASLARPRRLHRRLATLRAACLRIDSVAM